MPLLCVPLRLICVKYFMMKFFLFLLFLSVAGLTKGQNASPTHINFTPTSFSNLFSLNREPVLKIRPGDTVLTETIDAGGFDKNGVRRQKPGNPLTGPFYIENCSPGDVLAVTITKLAFKSFNCFYNGKFFIESTTENNYQRVQKVQAGKMEIRYPGRFCNAQ